MRTPLSEYTFIFIMMSQILYKKNHTLKYLNKYVPNKRLKTFILLAHNSV